MTASRFLSGLLAASMVLTALPVAADENVTSDASSSSSSSVDARTEARIKRCKRFGNGDDYERCARLVRRLPLREVPSTETEQTVLEEGMDWKWTNILNRLEEKITSAVKFAGSMARLFCRDRTEDSDTTSRECMSRLREPLKARVNDVIDEVFRGDLPSSR